ncbi:MAG: AAA family ATPase [Myxococcota bacterium]
MDAFRFGDCEADPAKFELRRAGRLVRVQPIVLETLLFLVRHRGRVVSKRELEQGPWKGWKVSDAAVSRAVMLARRAIGDHAREVIVTVHRRGYRFEGSPAVDASSTDSAGPDVGNIAVGGASVAATPSAAGEPAAMVGGKLRRSLPNRVVRKRELRVLFRAYERARAGCGQLIIVSGEAGSGKTKLVEAFANGLQRDGVWLGWGRCWRAHSAPRLWPWLEVARSMVTTLQQFDTCATRELAFQLGDLFQGVAQSNALTNVEPIQLFDAMMQGFRHLSRLGPCVVLLEDVHEADALSLLLLEFVRQRLGEIRLVIVATRRSQAWSGSGDSPVDEVGQHVHCVQLSPLGAREVKRLLASLGQVATDAHCEALCAATGGNARTIAAATRSPRARKVMLGGGSSDFNQDMLTKCSKFQDEERCS